MRWTVPFPMFPADHLVPMARAAEANGFDTIAVPDSVFYPRDVDAAYPYSPDGGRFWAPDTPFVDPFVSIAAMAAVTDRVAFTTNVVKLPLRDPLLVAKQLSSMAMLAGDNDRVSLGIGISWMPEESRFTRTDFHTRGKRADEMIEIIQLICAGNGPEFVEYHGQFYDFDPLMISPAPTHRVKIHVGGLSEPAYRRAARLADGWISVQNTEAEIRHAIDRLTHHRNEYGRAHGDFAINVLPIDVFDIDGYQRLEAAGVTELQVLPWYFDPRGGDPDALSTRVDSLAWFADEVIAKY